MPPIYLMSDRLGPNDHLPSDQARIFNDGPEWVPNAYKQLQAARKWTVSRAFGYKSPFCKATNSSQLDSSFFLWTAITFFRGEVLTTGYETCLLLLVNSFYIFIGNDTNCLSRSKQKKKEAFLTCVFVKWNMRQNFYSKTFSKQN